MSGTNDISCVGDALVEQAGMTDENGNVLTHVLTLPLDTIGQLDIAVANLLCAAGLPEAHELDIHSCLATLQQWTDGARRYTQRTAFEFRHHPERFNGHRGFAHFVALVTFLRHPRSLGIGYQPSAIGSYDFSDSRDDFLHGIVSRRTGTCASLPLLFVAIGRRLGYPIYLAVAKGHVFCQWLNDDGSHVNLEGTNLGGGEMPTDDHFRNWPHPLSPADIDSNRYLRPLSPPEELALFLETRGHCLADNGRFDEAETAYRHARRYAPDWSDLRANLLRLWKRYECARLSSGSRTDVSPCSSANVAVSLPTRCLFVTVGSNGGF